jgi:trk system potassium uptake protein TrkA
MKKQFVVIGLGRFGGSVIKTLQELGHDVMGIDQNERLVQEYAPLIPHVYVVDSTDVHALRQIGVQNFDHAIVAIGDDLQASILTTLIVKDIGVPFVTAKATTEYHRRVLDRIGADRIIMPERDTGVRVAHQLTRSNVIDYLELSQDFMLVEVLVPPHMQGQTLKELNVRAKYGCNIVAIRKRDGTLNVSPLAEDKGEMGDLFVVIGNKTSIVRFEKDV